MPDPKNDPSAHARSTESAREATAVGAGSAASASEGSSVATGNTAASVGRDYARAEAQLPSDSRALLQDVNSLNDQMRHMMAECLSKVARMGVQHAQTKETVDELYAAHFARAVRASSPQEEMLKKVLGAALGLGADKLLDVLGALALPKAT